MTAEEFKSQYYEIELKCSRCGKPFPRVFRKDSPKEFIDLYTSGENPIYCDECWDNHVMDELLSQIEQDKNS